MAHNHRNHKNTTSTITSPGSISGGTPNKSDAARALTGDEMDIITGASDTDTGGDPGSPPITVTASPPSDPGSPPITVTASPPSDPGSPPITVTASPPDPGSPPITVTASPPPPPNTSDDSHPCNSPGDRVDRSFLAVSEGARHTKPYVPRVNDPNNPGHTMISPTSGVTVGTGVDLHGANLSNYNLPQELENLLQPYTSSSLIGQAAQDVLDGKNPNIPAPRILTNDEVTAIDDGAYNYFYSRFAKQFNNNAVNGFTHFEQLPSGAQTAILDFAYQFGIFFENSKNAQARQFFQDIVNGRWQDAINLLKNFTGTYSGKRRTREANSLQDAVNTAGNNMPTLNNPC